MAQCTYVHLLNKLVLLYFTIPQKECAVFTSIFLKEWKYGDGKKNRVRDYCRF